MAARSRPKGIAFEREVARTLEAAGWTARGLESGGDLIVVRDGCVLHVEAKRQERLQLPTWLRQQDRDCPPGVSRILVFKQSRQPAYVVEPLGQWVARQREGDE